MTATRGTSNKNVSGSSYDRKARKNWLLETYRADVEEAQVWWLDGVVRDVTPVVNGVTTNPPWVQWKRLNPGFDTLTRQPACRCFRCGVLLVYETLTVDRIIPGCLGGTYARTNIRPACGPCNEKTGGALANAAHLKAKKAQARRKAS